MPTNASERIVSDFVISQARSLPVADRIRIYRALAEVSGDSGLKEALTVLVTQLEAAEKANLEFNLKYGQN